MCMVKSQLQTKDADYRKRCKLLAKSAGAFTPVRSGSKQGAVTPSRSRSSLTPTSRSPSRVRGSVNSARKSLLGKLTSVAKQQSRSRRDGSAVVRRSSSFKSSITRSNSQKEIHTRVRNHQNQSRSRSADTKIETRGGGKRRESVEEEVKERKAERTSPASRLLKRKVGLERRYSSRLQSESPRSTRQRTSSDNTDDVDGSRDSESVQGSSSRSKKKEEDKKPAEKKKRKIIPTTKPRRPYKIRPLERVRTRGYSLLLASKLSLKRAKSNRDTIAKRETLANVRGRSEVSATRTDKKKESEASGETRNVKKAKSLSSHTVTSPPSCGLANSLDSVPVFEPSEAEFADPIAYIRKIQPEAESHGMCRIIPPPSWKMESNKLGEEVRFTSQIQHVHRLQARWGPNVQHTAAINHHLLAELSELTYPQIGGVEIDLPQLYQLVEEAGGLRKMADKKHWARVADTMNIPKQTMDRTMRLYDIYCKHVLPYATLSDAEREQLEEEVKAIHQMQSVEDEAILRGKSMSATWFSRIARNVQSMWFQNEPSPEQVEDQYWEIVEKQEKHVAVQCGHINTRTQSSGFPTRRDSPYSKHPWNLNNIPHSSDSILKYLGLVPGISIPTLHLSMLFSTSCWSSDPHNLPYIQYLHSGADIVWYCIPSSQRTKFRSAMSDLTPSLIVNKPRWLKEDCVMVNPKLLKERGVRVQRCVHSPRQFVVVFPGTFTSTISCGFTVSESVHFATSNWIGTGMDAASALVRSNEKELFSMCALLCGLAQDSTVDANALTEVLPLLSSQVYKELDLRTQLLASGLRSEKKSAPTESQSTPSSSKKKLPVMNDEKSCDICGKVCYLSMIVFEEEDQILCLDHGLKHVQKKKSAKSTRLFVKYSQAELESFLKDARERLTALTTPPSSNKTRATVKQSTTPHTRLS